MEPLPDWHILKDRFYKFDVFNPIQYQMNKLDIFFSRTAVAKWGGIVAAMKNTDHINLTKLEDILRDCVAFFTNDGKLFSSVPYKDIEKVSILKYREVVLFDFIEDELLILLKADGTYYLIDPFKATKEKRTLDESFKRNNIINAQVCGNGFVVMREVGGFMEFSYLSDVYEPHFIKMKNAPELTQRPAHWVTVPANASFSRKLEVQVTHPEAGIILMIEDEQLKTYYNGDKAQTASDKQLPHLPNIKMIGQSPSHKFFSYLSIISDQWVLSVLSDDFQAKTYFQIPLNLTEDGIDYDGPIKDKSIIERPQRIVWCGEDCVVIQLTQSYILVGPDTTLRMRQPSKHLILYPEVDGLRFISQKENKILRRLPDPYINIFSSASTMPGAILYTAYECFQLKQPIEDQELRSKKNDLRQAVEDCILAGQFELDMVEQKKLLKAASYGLTFLGNQALDTNELSDVCRNLRVQNCLRRTDKIGGRSLTHFQVYSLHKNESLFVKLMLRYNLHHLAHEVSKLLKFSLRYRSQIYTHWACCKVEVDIEDDKLCQIIKEKIKEERGVSFTEIAHRAIEVNKAGLALKLLDNEPSLAKRVPVLLWMASYKNSVMSYYEKALEDAIKSRDSNLIYLVVVKFLKGSTLEEQKAFQMLSVDTIVRSHLITYLKSFDYAQLKRYFEFMSQFDESAFLAIQQAYQSTKITDRIKFLEEAKRYFDEEQKDSFYAKIISDQLDSLNDIKNQKSSKKKPPQELPLNDILEFFFKQNELKMAQEFASVYKIPERRFYLTRTKQLIQSKTFDELDKLVAEKNKKTEVLPYVLISNLLIQNGEEQRGFQMLLKMPDIEECVNIFLRIDQFRFAAQAAMKMKKNTLLLEVRQVTQDPSVQLYIDNYLAQNPKK